MRATFHARYSTEEKSGASISHQHRVCQRLAERRDFTAVQRLSDAAVSGQQRSDRRSILAIRMMDSPARASTT